MWSQIQEIKKGLWKTLKSHQIIQNISDFLTALRLLFTPAGFDLLGIRTTTDWWWQIRINQVQKLCFHLIMVSGTWRENRKGSRCIRHITAGDNFWPWGSEASRDQHWTYQTHFLGSMKMQKCLFWDAYSIQISLFKMVHILNFNQKGQHSSKKLTRFWK